MTTESTDEAREERISMEIIVDAYGGEEQALGWYSYLEGAPRSSGRAHRKGLDPKRVTVDSLPHLLILVAAMIEHTFCPYNLTADAEIFAASSAIPDRLLVCTW